MFVQLCYALYGVSQSFRLNLLHPDHVSQTQAEHDSKFSRAATLLHTLVQSRKISITSESTSCLQLLGTRAPRHGRWKHGLLCLVFLNLCWSLALGNISVHAEV